jgi:hypothetical protein
VCHPLAGGFWFSEVKHWVIVAFVRPLISSADGVTHAHQFCDPMEGSKLDRRQKTMTAYGSPALPILILPG